MYHIEIALPIGGVITSMDCEMMKGSSTSILFILLDDVGMVSKSAKSFPGSLETVVAV